jgi:crotonobetainyl-CoA:carnitine CoA-transferase CaiB-like acyl-CoA transferase
MSDIHALPLADVRILAIEQFGAGPWATLQLSDLGADVIKVEQAAHGGDVARYVPPFQTGEDSLYFEALNRGKRSISLDLRHPDGAAVFRDLVRHADAVFCNLRGDQPKELGLRYDDLRAVNRKIVCCWLTGFGVTGPRAAQGTYDYVVQALGGWMSLTGEPDGPPAKTGISLVDFAGGYLAAVALLSALWRADRTGEGCDCDISLFETALALLNYLGTWTATNGYEPRRMKHSAHPSIVPFQAMRTADGWIVIACAKQKFWVALCDALDRRDLLLDARFTDFASRHENRDALVTELNETIARWTTSDLIERLELAGVPCGPVNDVRSALEDPQAIDREVVQEVEHPTLGPVQHIATPLRLSTGWKAPARAPRLGEHTREVLTELCRYKPDRIAELARAGAIHTGRRVEEQERA